MYRTCNYVHKVITISHSHAKVIYLCGLYPPLYGTLCDADAKFEYSTMVPCPDKSDRL